MDPDSHFLRLILSPLICIPKLQLEGKFRSVLLELTPLSGPINRSHKLDFASNGLLAKEEGEEYEEISAVDLFGSGFRSLSDVCGLVQCSV